MEEKTQWVKDPDPGIIWNTIDHLLYWREHREKHCVKMCIRDRINAAADLLVVDEAHNLDDKVRSATTERLGHGMLLSLIHI